GRNVRLPPNEWCKHGISELAWGRIRDGIREESVPEWPDEKREAKVIYPYRLRFDNVQRVSQTTPLSGTQNLPAELVDALRLSAISGSGYIREVQAWPVGETAPTTLPPQTPNI